jgi:thiamine pyrophosphate-dependent acetolactate synthase large subunit-like protein
MAMALVSGDDLTAKTLKAEGVDTIFYLMGGPIDDIILYCQKAGIRTTTCATNRAPR